MKSERLILDWRQLKARAERKAQRFFARPLPLLVLRLSGLSHSCTQTDISSSTGNCSDSPASAGSRGLGPRPGPSLPHRATLAALVGPPCASIRWHELPE